MVAYVARVAAVLNGSMTEREIRWDLPLCQGQAYEQAYFQQLGWDTRWITLDEMPEGGSYKKMMGV